MDLLDTDAFPAFLGVIQLLLLARTNRQCNRLVRGMALQGRRFYFVPRDQIDVVLERMADWMSRKNKNATMPWWHSFVIGFKSKHMRFRATNRADLHLQAAVGGRVADVAVAATLLFSTERLHLEVIPDRNPMQFDRGFCITADNLQCCINNCRSSLQSLKLPPWTGKIDSQESMGTVYDALEECTLLQELSLCQAADPMVNQERFFHTLRNLRLRELDLSHTAYISYANTSALFKAVGTQTALVSLNLQKADFPELPVSAYASFLVTLASITTLQQLNLSACDVLAAPSCLQTLGLMSNLTSLSINNGNFSLQDHVLGRTLRQLSGLEYLSMDHTELGRPYTFLHGATSLTHLSWRQDRYPPSAVYDMEGVRAYLPRLTTVIMS